MRLPPALKRALGLAAAGAAAVALGAPASAHPGPVDSSGGHYCTAAQNASGLCAPPTYHRHDEGGNVIVVTPGPEAAQLAGGQPQNPTQPGTPTTAPAPAPASPPPANPALAQTGPTSLGFAVFGFGLAAAGMLAVLAHRRIPLPVVLELERPPAS